MDNESSVQNEEEAHVPAAPKRRPGGRSARIRTVVMDAVMEMLRERGHEGLNVAEIASKVGVHESTIYRRWRNREELMVEAVMTHMETTIPLPDTGSFRTDLQAFLRESAHFLQSPDGELLTRSMFATMNHEDSQVRQTYWTARFSHSGIMVQRGIERGELSPATDPSALMTALTGAMYVRMLVLDAPLDEQFLDQITQIVLNGTMRRAEQ